MATKARKKFNILLSKKGTLFKITDNNSDDYSRGIKFYHISLSLDKHKFFVVDHIYRNYIGKIIEFGGCAWEEHQIKILKR